MILLDTNLLGRMTDKADPHYSAAHGAVRKLRKTGEQLVLVPQNRYEFRAIATRAKKHNGMEMPPELAKLWIGYFRRLCTVLPDRPELSDVWLELVHTTKILGFKAHDARLVAAMKTYGIGQILSFNASDFAPFSVTVLDPQSL
jgi:predicted nucleic acid-binding protein